MFTTQDHYPSRVGERETIVGRQDPVVYGTADTSTEHALNATQLASFEENGFLVIPDFMAVSEVEKIRTEAGRLKQSLSGREELVLEPDSKELRSIFALHRFSNKIHRLTTEPAILKPVQQILGSDVTIMQSRLNIKPAFKGKSFPWHSDFETWHVEDGMPRMRAVTAWLMLTDNTDCNGPLFVIPGSHKNYISCAGKTAEDNHKQSLRNQKLGVPRPESIEAIMQDHSVEAIYGKTGTLVIHDCNLLHGSPDNISPWSREVLMFVYNSIENGLVSPYSGLKRRPDYLAEDEARPLSADRPH